jgi:ABC-2 type transport system ATP-binding protein
VTDPAVAIENLTVRFGEFTAVDRVSLRVEQGEIFGFLGANGAGKTTTIRVLTGLLAPTAGRVAVAGLSFDNGADAIKARVGYMSQKFTLYTDLTVAENLEFAAALRKLPTNVYRRRSRELLDFIGFQTRPETLVRDLPGGLKQEVSLVAALLHDPEIVFLDEPTAGVSPAARARFWALIRGLSARGKTVFVTTHYMDEAGECGRIGLMRAGALIALGRPRELKEQAFPEPLYEIHFPADPPAGWREAAAAVGPCQPHGRRWHLAVRDHARWAAIRDRWGDAARVRRIDPSLEDVFLRWVEGGA